MESKIKESFATPVFRPTMAEFANFASYVKSLEAKKLDFAKIIPPQEWSPESQEVESDLKLTTVISQKAKKLLLGGFDLAFSKKPTSMLYAKYSKLSIARENRHDIGNMSLANIEDMHWKTICESAKLYALNNQMSLFGENVQIWNLDRFTKSHSSIHGTQPHKKMKNIMPGIQSPFTYFGAIFTSFGYHQEDLNLNSINFLHRGKPKIWYGIPESEVAKFEVLTKKIAQEVDCDYYVRHKTIMIPPSVLNKNGIKFTRIVQNAGEFVITFSGGYHSGYNSGFNMAEAVNFGSERWLKFYKTYRECNCKHGDFDRNVAMQMLTDMIERVINKLKLECADCPSKFTERMNLNIHMKYHHAPMLPSYQCSSCESKLLTSYGVREHMRDLHGINIDKASAEALNKPVKRRNKRAKTKT